MIWLFLGLALWVGAHLFKRVAPGPRAALQDRMGDASKALFAVVLVISVVLMVIGYRAWFAPLAYQPPVWGVHVNNTLMLVAVALFGLGSSKSRLRGALRHPMLTGMLVFALAHLLVNGDWASIVLFGTLGLWAVLEMIVINRAAPGWERPAPGTLAGDLRLIVITLVVYGVITAIHAWLGYWPFPG